MEDKFIMLNLEQDTKKLAEILGNETCKKILNYLTETKEASEQDISKALNIPLNTTEYNLKKLIEIGLVEKSKNFFWSTRGKKIPTYKAAKKHIVISPKSTSINKLKAILPSLIVLGILTLLLAFYQYNNINIDIRDYEAEKTEGAAGVLTSTNEESVNTDNNSYLLFALGAFLAVLIFTILNWRKL